MQYSGWLKKLRCIRLTAAWCLSFVRAPWIELFSAWSPGIQLELVCEMYDGTGTPVCCHMVLSQFPWYFILSFPINSNSLSLTHISDYDFNLCASYYCKNMILHVSVLWMANAFTRPKSFLGWFPSPPILPRCESGQYHPFGSPLSSPVNPSVSSPWMPFLKAQNYYYFLVKELINRLTTLSPFLS